MRLHICGAYEIRTPRFARVPESGSKTTGTIGDFSNSCSVELLEKAFLAVDQTHKQGLPIPQHVCYHLLQGCTKKKDLATARQLHSLIVSSRLDAIAIFGDLLIRLFTSCGCLTDANIVFSKVAKPSVYTWHAIISANARHGEGDRALDLYYRMQQRGISPNKFIFPCVLKACGSLGLVKHGKLVHDQIIRSGLLTDVVVGNALIDMYAKCGKVDAARRVFDKLTNGDVVSWSAMIAGYVQHGHGLVALQLFEEMQKTGIKPNRVTFLCSLQACGSIGASKCGQLIHDQIIRSGYESDTAIGNMLVDMYAKCGSIEVAKVLFDILPNRDVVSWGVMVSGYALHGHERLALEFFVQMEVDHIVPNKMLLICVLNLCGTIEELGQGKQVHNQIIRSGLESDVAIGNSLIEMYVKCESLNEAHVVFDKLLNRDVCSWVAMISGCAQHGDCFLALKLFGKLKLEGVKPNEAILSSILKACGSTGNLRQGMSIHVQVIQAGHESDAVVGNALVDMYAKCGNLIEAHKVFEKLAERDEISWGAMIAGYAQHGHGQLALEIFANMKRNGMEPNKIMFSCILKACSSIAALGQGKLIHEQIIRTGYESDLVIGNTLIDMYVKCVRLGEAQNVFQTMPNRDIVSWGAIIVGCAQHGNGLDALDHFNEMQNKGINANKVIFLGTLKACGSIGALVKGKLLHFEIIRSGFDSDADISSTIVDMYSKCGSLEDACNVFDGMQMRDGVAWGAMTAAYAHHGKWRLARQCLEVMHGQGLELPSIVYISVLSAYSHMGQLNDGQQFFTTMTNDHGISPSINLFNCMVDILGRAGHLEDAKNVLQTMPIMPDIIGWVSLLSACRTYGDVSLGRFCFDEVIPLHPDIAAGYMLMCNIYAGTHLWDDALKLQELRKCMGAWKKPGKAWIEVNKNLQEFIVGDKAHPQSEYFLGVINRVMSSIRKEGYIPHLDMTVDSIIDDHKQST